MDSSTRRVVLVMAVLATMLIAVPAASGVADDSPLLVNQDWEAPIVVSEGIQADGIQGILDDDPLGLVPKTPFVQRYSLDTDNWEVWLCGPVTDSMETVLAKLRSATVDYYEAISGGLCNAVVQQVSVRLSVSIRCGCRRRQRPVDDAAAV